MLVLLIFAVVIGAVVAGITKISFLFWVVAIAAFICGLPFALISGFFNDIADRAQNREDYREEMRQNAEEERYERYMNRLDEIEEKYDMYMDRLDNIDDDSYDGFDDDYDDPDDYDE